MGKRWVYQGNSLTNWQRPITPKLVVIKQIGNGLVNVPKRKKGKK
jgi:hypothetical protein